MELRYEVSLNFYFCTFYLRYVENENLIMMNDDLFLFLARNIGIEFVRFERKDCSNSSHSKLHCNRLIETRASIKRGPAFVTTAYPNSLNSVWDRVAQCRSRKCLTGDRRLRYPVTRSFSSFFFFLTRLTGRSRVEVYPFSLEELGSLDFSTSIHFENSFKSVRFGNFFQ